MKKSPLITMMMQMKTPKNSNLFHDNPYIFSLFLVDSDTGSLIMSDLSKPKNSYLPLCRKNISYISQPANQETVEYRL